MFGEYLERSLMYQKEKKNEKKWKNDKFRYDFIVKYSFNDFNSRFLNLVLKSWERTNETVRKQ